MDNSETFKSLICIYQKGNLAESLPKEIITWCYPLNNIFVLLGSIFSSPAWYTRCLCQILLTLYLEIHKWLEVFWNILFCYLLLWFSCSVVSDTFAAPWTAALQAPLWDLPGENFGVGYCALLQGFLPTLGWNLHLLRWQASSLPLSHQGSPCFAFSGFSNNVFMFTPIKFIFKRIYQIFSMVRKFDQPVGWEISFIRRWYWT